ncbi:MAG TPA: alanine dehydrogenase [Bacteroidales bacterium]|nr:alanine dehydrogenase [Bacteroidales bacterium]
MDEQKGKYADFILPREEMLEVGRQRSKLTIGVPKETHYQENRIPLVPDGAALLVKHGHQVLIEAGAGLAAHFADHDYSEAGAQIVYSPEEVFVSDLILKVSPFTPAEIERVKLRQTLVSTLQMGIQKEEYFRGLSAKKVTALAYELIRDRANTFPLVRAMSEIAGSTSIFIAAEYLADARFGKGKMFGGFTGIHPSEVVIIGAGTVGEYAARSAIGLGATVKVFDNAVYRLRRLQNNLGVRIFTSILHPQVMLESMRLADVVIGAVHAREGRSPCLVTESMIRQMKEGSVIIDVSIDQGGCFETSRPTTQADPVFQVHGVTHYCVPNIPSKVPHTASQALNNILVPLVINIAEGGNLDQYIKTDYGIRQGVYLYNGTVTSPLISRYFNLPSQDIDLLITGLH